MGENVYEITIPGLVFPDEVKIVIAGTKRSDVRSYVSKDLYESVLEANYAWQAQNAKLKKLVHGLWYCTKSTDGPGSDCEHCPLGEVEGKPLELACENMLFELSMEPEEVEL